MILTPCEVIDVIETESFFAPKRTCMHVNREMNSRLFPTCEAIEIFNIGTLSGEASSTKLALLSRLLTK